LYYNKNLDIVKELNIPTLMGFIKSCRSNWKKDLLFESPAKESHSKFFVTKLQYEALREDTSEAGQ
jgi:hypothetical protein